MSSDINDIGREAHQEAVAIAVPNGSERLVVESIIGTVASGLLRLQGLRGELSR